eukprot:scaffold114797_cov51-Attheya_sp.AAC.13
MATFVSQRSFLSFTPLHQIIDPDQSVIASIAQALHLKDVSTKGHTSATWELVGFVPELPRPTRYRYTLSLSRERGYLTEPYLTDHRSDKSSYYISEDTVRRTSSSDIISCRLQRNIPVQHRSLHAKHQPWAPRTTSLESRFSSEADEQTMVDPSLFELIPLEDRGIFEVTILGNNNNNNNEGQLIYSKKQWGLGRAESAADRQEILERIQEALHLDESVSCTRHCGRVVKAADSKSSGVSPRRFESCQCRKPFWTFTISRLESRLEPTSFGTVG